MLKFRIEWYDGGYEIIEAKDFEHAAKRAIRRGKRLFRQVSAVVQSKD